MQPDLEKLLFGRRNAAWIENETHKLLGMMESSVGATLNTGGTVIGDIFGTHPRLGWENLVREFLRTI